MLAITSNQPDEILAFVREWVELLARGEYAGAHEMLYVPDGSPYRADPEITKKCIAEYSLEYRRARKADKEKYRPVVTSPSSLAYVGEQIDYWPEPEDRDERGITSVEYYLPLDGEWSDLRASFKVLPQENGGCGMLLTDLSVP